MSTQEECNDLQEEIHELRSDLSGYANGLENHIVAFEEHRMDFQAHVRYFAEHERVEMKNHSEMIEAQQANTLAITELSKSTRDMTEAWQTAQGVVKFGASIGRFAKWLSSIAVIGVLFTWMLDKVK